MSNLKQVGTALSMYLQDNDDRYPLAISWWDGLRPYIKNDAVSACPARPKVAQGYAYNAALSGCEARLIQHTDEMPALFESSRNQPNGADMVATFVMPHNGRGNLLFADGHVKGVTARLSATAGLSTQIQGNR